MLKKTNLLCLEIIFKQNINQMSAMLAGKLNISNKFSTPIRLLCCENDLLLRCYSSKTGAKFDAQSKKLLQVLRKETGYPLINCRQALQAANYDLEKVGLNSIFNLGFFISVLVAQL